MPGEGRHRLLKPVFQAGNRFFFQRFSLIGNNAPGNSPAPIQEALYLFRIEAERLSKVISIKVQYINLGSQQHRPIGIAAAMDSFKPTDAAEDLIQQADNPLP